MSDTAHADIGSNSRADVKQFESILDSSRVLTSEEDRQFYSQDIFNQGETVQAVLQPASVEELAAAVKAATSAGMAVFPRGGGMSYTDGYLPTVGNAVTIDTQKMNQIVEINTEDMYVTVQPGVTWEELDLALKEKGVRTPFWGPFSGKFATVGGSVTQNSVSYGSGDAGPAGDSLTGFEIVTANGDVIKTGSGGGEHGKPFYRHFGPDLTGLFSGDAGALGIKATISLRLMKRKPEVMCFSYNFDTFDAMGKAASAVAREGIVTESFGIDPELNKTNLGRTENAGMGQALKNVLAIGAAGRNPISGLAQMIKVAMAGTSVFATDKYTYHFIVEGHDQASASAKAKLIRKHCDPLGMEVPNTVPATFRANPWQPMNNIILHPTGMRWVPCHGVVSFSRLQAFHDDLTAFYASYEKEMQEKKVIKAAMFTTAMNGFLYEPVFYWEDNRELFHNRVIDAEFLPVFQNFETNMAGRELVTKMKSEIIDLFHKHGAIHFQVGKVYPLLRNRNSAAVSLLRSVKAHVDPKNLINPGALGL